MGRDRYGPATIFQLYVRTCLAHSNIAKARHSVSPETSRGSFMQWRELDLTRNGSGSTLASSPVRNGIARRHRRAPGVRASRPPGSKCRRYQRVRPKTRQDVPNQHIFRRQSQSHPYIQQYHCSPANDVRSNQLVHFFTAGSAAKRQKTSISGGCSSQLRHDEIQTGFPADRRSLCRWLQLPTLLVLRIRQEQHHRDQTPSRPPIPPRGLFPPTPMPQ